MSRTRVWNLLKWLNQTGCLMRRSRLPVDLQPNAEWFKGSILTHIWKLPHQRLQLSDAALPGRLRYFAPLPFFHLWGIIHPAECWSEKGHYVKEKRWNAQSDLRGVNVRGGRQWDGDRGVSQGLVLHPYLIPYLSGGKPPTGPEWTQSDAGRAGVLGVVWWWRLLLPLDHHRTSVCSGLPF